MISSQRRRLSLISVAGLASVLGPLLRVPGSLAHHFRSVESSPRRGKQGHNDTPSRSISLRLWSIQYRKGVIAGITYAGDRN